MLDKRAGVGSNPMPTDIKSVWINSRRGPPWPGAMRNLSTKRQRCTPLGLMLVEPDYVEGFLPAKLRRKRPRRLTAAPFKLQPLALALALPSDSGCDLVDERPTTTLSAGGSSHNNKNQRKRSRQLTDGRGRDDDGVGGGTHLNASHISSPSLDVVTSDYRGLGIDVARRNSDKTTMSEIRHEDHPSGSEGGNSAVKEDGEAEDDEGWKAGGRSAGSTASTENDQGSSREGTANKSCAVGSLLTPTAKKTVRSTRSAPAEATAALDCVLPVALPGEAHEISFGAAARGIILASGSSRFMVSRHAQGRVLLSKVKLPWSPPVQRPWRTSGSGGLDECPSLSVTRPQPSQQRPRPWSQHQHWEQHHAAINIQRVWRGYLARADLWTDGGVGFHAVATRIQRMFRGWRGKIRAGEALARKRARAATQITALGRGFQGRQRAKLARVSRLNTAAAAIQRPFRARVVRRWLKQLALANANRRAVQIQAAWRGFAARKRFSVLDLHHHMEEEALKSLCFGYTGRAGWVDQTISASNTGKATRMTPAPALPEGFALRLACRSLHHTVSENETASDKQGDRDDAIGEDGGNAGLWCFTGVETSPPAELASTEALSAKKRTNAGGVVNAVFGGAFHPCLLSSISASVQANGGVPGGLNNASGGGGDESVACTAPAAVPAAMESRTPPTEKYFVAYGHCLLAGAGTGARDEAAEEAAAERLIGMVDPPEPRSLDSVSSRVRASEKRRKRGYGDALEVFQEGLQLFPSSAALLYGASLAMQAMWFTDGQGGSPTGALLEASLFLLNRAWALDADRRAYQEAEAFFLAAGRIARRRLWNAERAAEAAREAKAAEIRLCQELSAANQGLKGKFGGLLERVLGERGGESEEQGSTAEEPMGEEEGSEEKGEKDDEHVEAEDIEPEELTLCRKAAAVATLHVALWSEIANGNHDMDLRRAETVAAYRRIRKLYARAADLDADSVVPEIKASERIFVALYRAKSKLVMTRPLRLQLPPHPDPLPVESHGSIEDDIEALKDTGGDYPEEGWQSQMACQQQHELRQAEAKRLQQEQDQQQELQEQDEQQQHGQRQPPEPALEHSPARSTASSARSPRWPFAAQRVAKKLVSVVRERAKGVMRISPMNSPWTSPRNSPRNSPRSPRTPTSPKSSIMTPKSLMSPRSFGLTITAAGFFRSSKRLGGSRIDGEKSQPSFLGSPKGEAFAINNASSEPGALAENPVEYSLTNSRMAKFTTKFFRGRALRGQEQKDGGDDQVFTSPAACTSPAGAKWEYADEDGGDGHCSAELEANYKQISRGASAGENAAQGPVPSATPVLLSTVGAKSTETGDGSVASAANPVELQRTNLRVTVTAWRCGEKLILRVDERDADVDSVGGSGGVGRDGGHGEERAVATPAGQNVDGSRRPTPLLGVGGSLIVVHEEEMERLAVAAVEEQVTDGRPRGWAEAKEPFQLVSEHFIGKVVLQPECNNDRRYRFSQSRAIGGRRSGFTVGLARYAAGLPHLDAMRQQEAEASARDDGARVLQRAFGGLLARAKCRFVCYELLEALGDIRQQGLRLLEEDILRQKEHDAATRIQGAWKGRKLRCRLSQLKRAAALVRRCFKRLEAKRAAMKAERNRLEGPEVRTVYHKGTLVSGVPLMLSVLRCGQSYKFVGHDQEACWTHYGYCYEFEVVSILQRHNCKYSRGMKEETFMMSRVGPIDPSRSRKVMEMLVSRLALVDALPAPTTELRSQHRYKTLVVQTTDLPNPEIDRVVASTGTGVGDDVKLTHDQRGLHGPGILSMGAEHGRGLRDTRLLVAKGMKRYQKQKAKWEERRRKQAFMLHQANKTSAAQS